MDTRGLMWLLLLAGVFLFAYMPPIGLALGFSGAYGLYYFRRNDKGG